MAVARVHHSFRGFLCHFQELFDHAEYGAINHAIAKNRGHFFDYFLNVRSHDFRLALINSRQGAVDGLLNRQVINFATFGFGF